MGAVSLGLDTNYILKIKELYGLDIFVESGTLYGGTAKASAAHYRRVFTVEKSSDFYAIAKKNLNSFSNVEVIHGDSAEILPRIMSNWDNILFWLDAHWSGNVGGMDTAGKENECPLLDELSAIKNFGKGKNYAIAIDDARLFIAPPSRPHDLTQWPGLVDILRYLPENFEVFIFDDVIFFVPIKDDPSFAVFLQNIVTERNSNKQEKQNLFCRAIRKITTVFCS